MTNGKTHTIDIKSGKKFYEYSRELPGGQTSSVEIVLQKEVRNHLNIAEIEFYTNKQITQ
jgi:hypothetical protein